MQAAGIEPRDFLLNGLALYQGDPQLSRKARIRSKMQPQFKSVRISQNEPNFSSRLEELTASMRECSGQPAGGGAEFIEQNLGGRGVRLRKPPKQKR